MEHGHSFSLHNPFISFTISLLAVLVLPPLFERLKLPGLVGLVFAGVVFGQSGFQLLDADTETMKLLGDIGKVYLMFVIGLEIDLEKFHKTRNRSMVLGGLIFSTSVIAGILVGRWFGLGWEPALLMGSLVAPQTLLAYPIVNRLGVMANEAITVTIGATIFTDIAALLLLAICLSIHAGEFSWLGLEIQVLSLGIYAAAVLFGLDWAGKLYFRKTGDEQGNQFIFVLLSVFLASVGAQLINVERIVGAFLAGLAVNDVLGNGPVKEKVEFVGSVLFIPFFFIEVGLLLDVPEFINTLTSSLGLTLAILGAAVLSKLISAWSAKQLYRYSWHETLTMWSLCIPHVAAPLAAAIIARDVGLINDEVFNGTIVLMVVTAIAGPIATAQFASQLTVPTAEIEAEEAKDQDDWMVSRPSQLPHTFTVVVPISNPQTDKYLVETAVLLAHHEAGQIVPLGLVKAHAHMDDPVLAKDIQQQRLMLQEAYEISQTLSVQANPLIRIADREAEGISHAAREQNADLVMMGWSQDTTGLRARLFGSTLEEVLWASHCPVVVMRLLKEPTHIHNILVPVRDLAPKTIHTVRFAQLFADAHHAPVTLLHVCDPRTPQRQNEQFKSDLQEIVSHQGPQTVERIKMIPYNNSAKAILRVANLFDLVIMRSMRRRTAGGLGVSDVTTAVMKEFSGSILLFGEPYT